MKKITTIAIAICSILLFATGNAQAQKFAYIDFQELMTIMPEYKKANTDMENYGKQLQEEAKKMTSELERKYEEYQKQEASMAAPIKDLKQKELRDLQGRIQEYQESAQENLRKKEQELLKPIVEKAKQAIADVAKAGGYTYVFDSSPGTPLLYKPDGDNIMSAVKKKLNIIQ